MNYIDLHCHIAWDIDDGIENQAEAEYMLQQAKTDGITAIIATPHFIPGSQDKEDVTEMNKRISQLNDLAEKFGVSIYKGCEIFLNDDYLEMIDDNNYNTINGSQYILCEFDVRKDISKNTMVEEQLYEMSVRGLIPVIAHVERYFHKGLDVNRIRTWIKEGYVIQMNRTSLLGKHGGQIQKNARLLLREGLVHVVATDAHRIEGNRICKMSDVYHFLETETDKSTAELLCKINPQHILRNEKVERILVKKKNWFQRMMRR